MDKGTSDTYTVKITFATECGDLPSIRDIEDLISGALYNAINEPVSEGGTGLSCFGVWIVGSEREPFDDENRPAVD